MWSSSGVAQSAAFLAGLSLLCHGATMPELSSGLSNYSFPKDFMFGVSTAAFQIEGGWNAGGKGESMWDTYIHEHPDYTPDRSNGDIAADSYHKYKEDVAMIKSMNLKYYRMSMSWPRLLPQGTDNHISEDGVRYYRAVFEELIKANITPIVTLFHWDMPTSLMDLGGWSNPKMVDYFEDYAKVAFDLFGDIIKTWTTMNEPHQHCYNGYGSDYFVPALVSNGIGDYLCAHYILLAHARAYHLYDKKYRATQKGRIGITLDAFWAEPRDISKIEDHEAAERYLQMHMGLYAHPIFSETGDYPDLVRHLINNKSLEQGFTRSRLPYFSAEEIKSLRGSSDFFGLNHYTTFLMSPSSMEEGWRVPSMDHDVGVRLDQNPNWPKPGAEWLTDVLKKKVVRGHATPSFITSYVPMTDIGMRTDCGSVHYLKDYCLSCSPVYPPGFRRLFNWLTKNYGKKVPIIVTENGVCDAGLREDYERVDYFNKYLNQLLLAIYEDGCNITGYFAWTLMDDFEWSDGYLTKFGLFSVDFNSTERTRAPKLSALNYAEIVQTRRIDFDKFMPPRSHNLNSIR